METTIGLTLHSFLCINMIFYVLHKFIVICIIMCRLLSLARANYRPYGIDFPQGTTGRFTNGRTYVDALGIFVGEFYMYRALCKILLVHIYQRV